jgi:hypothetical protein
VSALCAGEARVCPDAGEKARIAECGALNREPIQGHIVGQDLNWTARIIDDRFGSAAGPRVDAALCAAQGQGLGDLDLLAVRPGGHVDRVAGRGLHDGSGDRQARAYQGWSHCWGKAVIRVAARG